MSPLLEGAVIRGSGEDAFVVEYGDTIAPAIEARVFAFATALEAARPEGLVEIVPTFRSALVLYDSERTTQDQLLAALPAHAERGETPRALWQVPVCLDDAVAEDIVAAGEGLRLSPDAIRATFLAGTYQLGMYGFTPGCAYLSSVDPALHIPRRRTPRPPVVANSLIIAGGMANIMPVSMPTGWYVIGRVAVTMFRLGREPMVPFAVGDRLRFTPVSLAELERLASTDEDGGATRLA